MYFNGRGQTLTVALNETQYMPIWHFVRQKAGQMKLLSNDNNFTWVSAVQQTFRFCENIILFVGAVITYNNNKKLNCL